MSQETPEDAIDDGEFDHTRNTRWAIVVDFNTRGWFVTSVHEAAEVGEGDVEWHTEDDMRIGAFFDKETEALLAAIIELGGDSIEVRQKIEAVLSGVCRSFEEAMSNFEKWRKP